MGNEKTGGLVSKVLKNHLKNRQQYESNGLANELEKLMSLSEREFEIMRLIYDECTNQDIANQLFISITTVISHRKRLYRKLGVNNTVALIKLIMSTGVHTLEYADLH